MKCPKCHYLSFEPEPRCRNCGYDLSLSPPADLDLQIKRSWWSQVFDPALGESLPGLAMVNWFEWNKYEVEVDGGVDWTIGGDPAITEGFVSALPPWVVFAPDAARCAS